MCALFPPYIIIIIYNYIGVFIARGREDALVTKNLVPGEAVYGEKKISVEVIISYKCPFFFREKRTIFARNK